MRSQHWFSRARVLCLALALLLTLSGCELMDIKIPGSSYDNERGDDTATMQQADTDGGQLHMVPVIVAPSGDQNELLQIMRYSRIIQSYPRVRLKDEFKRVASELSDISDTPNQLRMAILLSIPNTSFENDKQALQLLSNIVNNSESPTALHEYAYVLLDTIQQRSEAEQTKKQLSDELLAERQKRAQLQQQLDALRTIEKSISQRQLKNEAEKQ